MTNLHDAVAFFKNADNIEIFTHIHPDGDALGSSEALCLALKKLGKKAKVTCLDKIPESFSYLFDEKEEEFVPEYTVTVDVASRGLLGDFPEDKVIDFAIDHHNNNKTGAKELLCDPTMAACGEIIFEIIKELEVELDEHIAECLYTAIATDTGCFKFSNANAHTFKTVSELCKYAKNGNFGYLNTPLFITKSKKQLDLEKEILSNMRYLFNGKVTLVTVDSKLLERVGISDSETGGIEQISKIPEGVVLGITLKERPLGFKVSMRSSDSLDCSKICEYFGGGGHHSAAGCFIEGTAYEVEKKITQYLEESDVL